LSLSRLAWSRDKSQGFHAGRLLPVSRLYFFIFHDIHFNFRINYNFIFFNLLIFILLFLKLLVLLLRDKLCWCIHLLLYIYIKLFGTLDHELFIKVTLLGRKSCRPRKDWNQLYIFKMFFLTIPLNKFDLINKLILILL